MVAGLADEGRTAATGIKGLDELLHGGLARRACVVVEGVPGAGKTTLGLQFIYEGATQFGEPGLVVTFEEFAQEIYRDAAAYGWDLRALEQQGMVRVLCTSPEVLREDALNPEGTFDRMVQEIGAQRAVVDSITQMAHLTADPLELRRIVYSLRNCFKRAALTTLWTKEVRSADGEEIPFEEYVADVVIRLGYRLLPGIGARVREIEITKSRARPHIAGRHLLEITPAGLRVAPSLPLMETPAAPPAGEKMEFVETGSAGLDGMLGGGLLRGSTTIAAGSTGVGKTVLGLQFLCAGAEKGEPGLMVSFEQPGADLARMARSLGLAAEHMKEGGLVRVLHERVRPGSLGLVVGRLAEELKRIQPTRVVVDAISTLAKTPGEEGRLTADLGAMIGLMRSTGATCVLCDETPGIVGEFEVTGGVMVSSLADSIIILRYVELASEMHRAVSVLKARCVDHDKEIREYVIGPGGMELREKFEVSTGLLRGTPVHRQVEDFF